MFIDCFILRSKTDRPQYGTNCYTSLYFFLSEDYSSLWSCSSCITNMTLLYRYDHPIKNDHHIHHYRSIKQDILQVTCRGPTQCRSGGVSSVTRVCWSPLVETRWPGRQTRRGLWELWVASPALAESKKNLFPRSRGNREIIRFLHTCYSLGRAKNSSSGEKGHVLREEVCLEGSYFYYYMWIDKFNMNRAYLICQDIIQFVVFSHILRSFVTSQLEIGKVRAYKRTDYAWYLRHHFHYEKKIAEYARFILNLLIHMCFRSLVNLLIEAVISRSWLD